MDTLPTQERLTSAGEEKLCKRWHQFAEDSHFDARKMAGLCQVSVRHLGRIVKQEAGVTPREWLRLRRMRVALSCLQGSASIKEIAYMLHYLQVSRFCRDFRLQFCPGARKDRSLNISIAKRRPKVRCANQQSTN